MSSHAPSTSRLRNALIYGVTLVALAGAGWGVRSAMRSPMFLLQVVELADLPDHAPAGAQELTRLADLPVGKINLFDLDLKPVEDRVMTHPWVRAVRLEKHFPQTLSISVVFREPQALIQNEHGSLSYVDVDGKVFGQVDLMVHPNLPVISASALGARNAPGGPRAGLQAGKVKEALQIIHSWERSDLAKAAQLSQLQWDPERGFRALVTYPLERTAGATARGRTFVDLGQDLDAHAAKTQFERLSQVFEYLTTHRVLTRQVWADAGKKIVVKTARGS